MSTMEVTTPSNVPNCESIPNVNSIRKERTDQNWAPGNWFIASVNMMKASPVPEADWKRNKQLEVVSVGRGIWKCSVNM